jgi:hypothetical protein
MQLDEQTDEQRLREWMQKREWMQNVSCCQPVSPLRTENPATAKVVAESAATAIVDTALDPRKEAQFKPGAQMVVTKSIAVRKRKSPGSNHVIKLEMVRPTKERCAEKPLFSQMEKRDKRPDLSCRLQRNC